MHGTTLFYDDKGFEVSPMSALALMKTARAVRGLSQEIIDPYGRIDIVRLIENSDIVFSIVPDDELKSAYGLTKPNGEIVLRESTYTGAVEGNGRDRFTLAHEIGHRILHCHQMGMARKAGENVAVFRNSEWQANEFGGDLLAPYSELLVYENKEFSLAAAVFGVSPEFIRVRMDKIKKIRARAAYDPSALELLRA